MSTQQLARLACAALGVAAFLMCSVCPAASQTTASSYVAVDLASDRNSWATGLNNRGQVVGGIWFHPREQASVWEPATGWRAIVKPAQDLGTSVSRINASGQMAGSATINYLPYPEPTYPQRAILWDGPDTFTELGTLPPDTDSVATALNDAGQVVGFTYAQYGWGDGTPSAFLYRDGAMYPIPGVDVAYGINNLGQVVGDGGGRAVVWDATGGVRVLGAEGAVSGAFAINDGGWVAGGSTTGEIDPASGNAIYRAFEWDPAGVARNIGTVDDLPQSYATSINKHGVVVGHCDRYDSYSQVPFIWDQANGIRKLDDLVDLPVGWRLVSAEAINDNGEIAGMAIEGTPPYTSSHGVLLRPVSEATPVGEVVSATPPSTTGWVTTLTFDSVEAAGETTVAPNTGDPDLPPTFELAGSFFNITTTATFSGGVQINVAYDPAQFSDPGLVRLLHYENGAWVDITTAVNPDSHVVTGTTTGFSPFAVARQVPYTYSWSGFLQPINAGGSSVFKLGSTVPVKFRLTGASAGIADAVARLSYAKFTDDVLGSEQEAVSTAAATTGNLFRYDASSDQYVFNLSTKGLEAGTYQLRVDLGDGVDRTVSISLK